MHFSLIVNNDFKCVFDRIKFKKLNVLICIINEFDLSFYS